MTAVTLLTVWCADCTESGAEHPGRLGMVERIGSGAVRWVGTARRGGRQVGLSTLDSGGAYLSMPEVSTLPTSELLPAACKRHGRGHVRSADVVGQSGRVVLKLIR